MKTLFVGDLSPTDVTNPLFEKGDIDSLFSDTVSLFEGNDVNFVNLECALTDSDKEIQKFNEDNKIHLTEFEILTMMAFLYFADEKCDGMGKNSTICDSPNLSICSEVYRTE